MQEWSPVALGELIDVKHGFAFKGEFFRDAPPGDVLLTPGNFAIGGGFQFSKLKYYDGPSAPGYVLGVGDLLVTMTDLSKAGDTLGYPATVPQDDMTYLHNQRLGKVMLTSDRVSKNFVYWLMRTDGYRAEILASCTGSTVKHTSPGRIRSFKFLLPSRAEQELICQVLGSLNDKIELNRRMNETLEAVAQAIFRDWFVDFGPTRRKIDGATDPVEIMGGLVADPDGVRELAELFPASIGDDGLPEGWLDGDLSHYALLNPESWTARNAPVELEYVDLANTKWGLIDATTIYLWSDAPSRARRIVRVGDTIVGTVRPGNGSYSFIGTDGLTVSTGFAVLRPKRPEMAELIYLAATSKDNIARLEKLADGGAYPAVRPDAVLASDMPGVSPGIVDGFSAICAPLFGKMEQNKRESRTLAATRDLLLPKLMSGGMRARDPNAVF